MLRVCLKRLCAIQTTFELVETHPLELYVGKNDFGELTLRYNGNFKPKNITRNSLLKIKQVKTYLYYSIMFICRSKDNLSLFYNFCEYMIEQTKNSFNENGYKELIKRYDLWKKFVKCLQLMTLIK